MKYSTVECRDLVPVLENNCDVLNLKKYIKCNMVILMFRMRKDMGMVAYAFNVRAQESDTGGWLQVQGQLGLQTF